MLVPHLPGEFEADILYGHAVLLFFIDVEVELMHLASVVRVGLEMEDARAFAVVKEAFAFDLAGIARDGEVNVLAAGLGDVDAGERACRPVGFVVRRSTVLMLNQRECNFARFVGLANRPVSATDVGRAVLYDREEQAEAEYEKSKRAMQSHKMFSPKCQPAVPGFPCP